MRLIISVVIALILAIGGYVFWWNQISETALERAEIWKQAREAEGYVISHDPIEISGFPYRVKAVLSNLIISEPNSERALSTTVANFWMVTQPWKINHVIFGSDGPITSSWQEGEEQKSATINASSALGSGVFDTDGTPSSLALDLKKIVAKLSWRPSLLIERLQLHSRPAKITDPDHASEKEASQYALRVNNIFVGEDANLPLGDTIEYLNIAAILEGKLSDFRNKETIGEWRDTGGILDIQDFNAKWGKSNLTANGTLSLDEANRPIGAFTAKMSGYNPLLKTLSNTGKMDKNAAKTASFALNLIAKENDKGDRYLDVPLSFQKGGLYLGPLFMLELNPLF